MPLEELQKVKPLESTHIKPVGRDTPYVLATAFFAILAYPTEGEYNKRDQFVEAVNAFRTKLAIKKGYLAKGKTSKTITSLPNQQISGRMCRAQARINKRLQASDWIRHVGLSHMVKASRDTSIKFKLNKAGKLQVIRIGSGKEAKSLTKIITDYANDRNMDHSYLFKSIWSSSRPVLHLAHALWHELSKFSAKQHADGGNPRDPFVWNIELMLGTAHDWIYSAVDDAEANRNILPLLHGISPSESIQLTYEEP